VAAQPDGAVPASSSVERMPGSRIPAAVADPRPSQWDIYRFEFAFFDLHAQRWQLFQEGLGTSDGADHRAQIESLLQSLRRAFAAIPRGTLFNSVAADGTAAGRETTINLKLEKPAWGTFGDKAAEHWRKFIGELRTNAGDDGLLELPLAGASPEDRRTLRDVLNELDLWPEKLSSDSASSSLPPQAACLLISLLPILRHWDVYGAIRQAWSTTRPGPPESLWQECGQMMEPFYCCHFSYHPDENENATLPNQLIYAEAVLSDLAQPELRPVNIALRECFTYVYEPKGEELISYRINAFFQDELQRKLAASKSQEDENRVESDVYYFAYPIFSGLGRRHFLHVYARPELPNATVGGLFEAWRQLHAQLNWPELRNVLVDELGEIDLVRLRHRVFKRLEDISKTENRLDKERDDLVFRLVANQLHLAFPIRCACHNGELGFYDEPSKDKVEVEAERIVGFPWQEVRLGRVQELEYGTAPVRCGGSLNRTSCSRVGISDSGRPPILWDDRAVVKLSPVQREIVAGRQQRLIQQEIEFARRVWEAHHATRQAAREHYVRARKRHKSLLVQKRDALLAAVRSGDGNCKQRFATATPFFQAICGMTPKDCFAPLFYIERLKEDTDDAWNIAYHEMVDGAIHRSVSEFIETGVVWFLLHANEAGSEKVDPNALRAVYESALAGTLVASIPNEDARKALGSIHKQIQEILHSLPGTEHLVSDIHTQFSDKLWNLQQLRDENFRKMIKGDGKKTAAMVLHEFLQLEKSDIVIKPASELRLNMCAPAFGLGKVWSGLLRELRELLRREHRNLYAFGHKGQASELSSQHQYSLGDFKKVPAAYQTCLWIGGQMDETYWNEIDIVTGKWPGVLDEWSNKVGVWGSTLFLKVHNCEVTKTLALPDRTERKERGVLPTADSAEPFHKWGYWAFVGIAVDGYKVE
jgi:hypothetical protein